MPSTIAWMDPLVFGGRDAGIGTHTVLEVAAQKVLVRELTVKGLSPPQAAGLQPKR